MKNILKCVVYLLGLFLLCLFQWFVKFCVIFNVFLFFCIRSCNCIEYVFGILFFFDFEQFFVVVVLEMFLLIVLVWIGFVDVGVIVFIKLVKWFIDGIGEKVFEIGFFFEGGIFGDGESGDDEVDGVVECWVGGIVGFRDGMFSIEEVIDKEILVYQIFMRVDGFF